LLARDFSGFFQIAPLPGEKQKASDQQHQDFNDFQ
jgi:hypothetical protein